MTLKSVQLNLPRTASGLRLNLRQLKVFVATARAGSTRAAADHMARSQSAASAALVDLEGSLGVRLFDRVGRRLVLNEHGRTLLPRAESLLDHAAEVEHLFDGEHATPLRMAASLTIGEYLLPELIGRWKISHPSSPVNLMIGNSGEVVEAVTSFEADIGFIEGPQTHPDLVLRPWLMDRMAIIAAPHHPSVGTVVDLKQLRQAAWALREPGSGTREAAERWLVERLGNLNVDLVLGSTEALKGVVASSSLLGCVSVRAIARELAQGTLVEIATRLPAAMRRLTIVVHRERRLGLGTLDFLSMCSNVDADRMPRT
ncbi:MAG: LysR family transcriptional regulator [Rhodoferax sp.]|jgi:DNA-binding transcriptional LysR family regulator|uniref:LysR family transcriptional regulator n=1 Tax=Rhodoferax sp. TaxID=50421 RepID=UPI00272F2ACA|nr:LysR family transcriptional regulator [Rhodoferax sp.]MDP1531315.1 LysR family transcriptional regulator [Rhodoferax sp.]MDP1942365.1 LysR family transcriptional regulator [Rhodoferax sp.]MDP2440096.1 LysR family transcriptional regulator [Rhodoferax sp.]